LEDIDKNKDGVISLEEYIGKLRTAWLCITCFRLLVIYMM